MSVEISRSKIKLLQKLRYIPPPSVVAEPYCRIRKHHLHADLELLLRYGCLEKENFFGMKVPCRYLCWGFHISGAPSFSAVLPEDFARLMGWDVEAHLTKYAEWWFTDVFPLKDREFAKDQMREFVESVKKRR